MTTETTTITHRPSPEFGHFVQLARTGSKNRGASPSERKCWLVADALLDTVPSLDDLAVAGLIEFIGLIKGNDTTLREMIGKS